MWALTPILAFLSIAVGFSWAGCASTFNVRPHISQLDFAVATASFAIFISAIGLALSSHGIWPAIVVIAAGAALAWAAERQLPLTWSLLISGVAIAVYIHGAFE
jgi:hypothetical protein